MHAKHEGKHTLRAPCIQNMQEIPGAGFSGQPPHSHIGELKCVQNTKENIPESSMYAKYARNPRCRIFRPATAQPYRRAPMQSMRENTLSDQRGTSQAIDFLASYYTAIYESSN